jgi:ferric-dicitrate binding protein FerR (iron transport regulator)
MSHHMNESNIRDLLKLYEEGKATEEQRQLVEAYLIYHQQQSPKKAPDEKNSEDPLQEIMEKIRMAREQEPKEAPVYPMGGAAAYPMEEAEEAGRTGRRRRTAWMAAASIALIITAGLLWRQSSHKPGPEPIAITYKTIRAAPGKMIHLRLSDSSEVWLNAGAILRYPQPFDDKMRKLELLDGEAFFQVHPEANRGFEVQTDRLLTKVLGTSFNIKSYRESQQMSVAVSSGKVAVIPRPSDQGTTLLHDQEARYNTATGRLIRSAVASDRTRDWKNGTFNFMEESLGDIAIELEHYFNADIQFKYPGLKKYIFSASFRHTAPLKDILTTLCLLNQNHFTQIDAQHYVIH